MKRATLMCGLCILAVAVGAFAIRLPRLASRPMHPDEANQAYKTGRLLDAGTYAYDPAGHHGPTLYYLTLPALWLTSAKTYAESDEFSYRIVPVIFGVGLVLLVLLVGNGLGWPAAAVAAGLAAISSAMVFYSRYYVQEMLLVFFTFAAIAAAWRYLRGGSIVWAAIAGAALGLMFATKETWVLAAVAMAAALAMTALWGRWLQRRGALAGRTGGQAASGTHGLSLRGKTAGLIVAMAAALLVGAAFYSSFGSNWAGLADSVRAYGNYFHQASAEGGHIQPWYYYLAIITWQHPAQGLTWSEGPIVGLAIVGIVVALAGKGVSGAHLPLIRFLAFYTVVLTALYAAIPYKTPWCVLGSLHAMTLMAGVGAVALVRLVPCRWGRATVVLVLAVLALQLAGQSYRLNFRLSADPRNPYVYSHTSTNAVDLANLVDRLAAVSPAGRGMAVKVMEPNYWPLPWYLRKFTNVGFWTEVPAPPESADADVIIASVDYQKALDAALRDTYQRPGLFGLRHNVNVVIYVDEPLWEAFQKRLESETRAGGGNP
jgi:uncharacterized protein (TIGR03663 family)